MKKQSDHTEHLLVDRLRESEEYIPELSLVADAGKGLIVGHIMLSKAEVRCNNKTTEVLCVAPLSVLPSFQKQGIGTNLMTEAHRRATLLGYRGAVLLGHAHYYPRFGYRPASYFHISFPLPAPDECCMARELTPGGLAEVCGTVHFSAAFGIG